MSGLAEEDIVEAPWKRPARIVGLVLLIAAMIAGVWFMVKGLGGEAKRPARQVTRITIIPDTPPPPPPPPPKEQPKPEPAKTETKAVKVDQPKPQDAPKPDPDPQLKMEGEAGDGPSPFAAGEVTQEYIGGDIGGGGGNALQYAFYTRLLQRHLQLALTRNDEIKRLDYRVKLKVWLTDAGVIRRAEMIDTTGDAEMDARLRAALTDLPAVPEAPPAALPQPISVRITNRVTG